MARTDRRFDRSAITLEHASARGRVLRNADNFTRGSQLIGHQFAMFRAGVRVPILIWFSLFVGIYWIMLSAVMGEHEVQLCSWRLGSALWTWMEFDPFKPMNIVLHNGMIRRTSIGYIPYLPDVQVAVSKAIKAILESLAAASLMSFPVITWFVSLAQRRGSSILQERHERGATLVDKSVLVSDVLAHNQIEFEKSAAKLFPGFTPTQVQGLPFAARKAAGLHHPYSIADIPYPYNLESSHTIVIGTTGSGKTTQLRQLVAEMRRRQDSAVIFDLTGAFVEAFYNPETDTILNPGDGRCPSWSLFDDCTTQAEFTAAAQAIVPNDGGSADPFWVVAARGLFVQMCLKLQRMGLTTNRALAQNLVNAPLKRVSALLKGTSAAPYTAEDAARLAESVRAVFNANADALINLPEMGPRFSIRDWIRRPDKPGSILFVTARHVDMPLYKMLLTLWLDIAVNTLMTLPRTNRLRTWFLFDELGALHRLPAIENGLQTARGFGGAMVLGLHSFARLQAVYGREGAENLTSLARTKLILATADRKTAEQCAEFIGHREVRQMDEAYAYGSNNLRDASTLTPKKEIAPLVIPDDITNLPSLHGFIKFPDGFPAARIVLQWRDYPDVARGYEPRTDPVRDISELEVEGADEGGEDVEDGGVGGEGEGRAKLVEQTPVSRESANENDKAPARTAPSGKPEKTADEVVNPQVLTEAETAANLLSRSLASAINLDTWNETGSAAVTLQSGSPDVQPDYRTVGGTIPQSGLSEQTTKRVEVASGPNKAGFRNDEHRQAIIGNELNTDFGVEDKGQHHHHPDDGMDLG